MNCFYKESKSIKINIFFKGAGGGGVAVGGGD